MWWNYARFKENPPLITLNQKDVLMIPVALLTLPWGGGVFTYVTEWLSHTWISNDKQWESSHLSAHGGTAGWLQTPLKKHAAHVSEADDSCRDQGWLAVGISLLSRVCTLHLWNNGRMISHTDRAQQASKCIDRTNVSFLLKLAEFWFVNIFISVPRSSLLQLYKTKNCRHADVHMHLQSCQEDPHGLLHNCGMETIIEALHGMSHLGCHKVHLINKQKEKNTQMRRMWPFAHESCAMQCVLLQSGVNWF